MAKQKILGKAFWKRKTLSIARDLIGCFLVREIDGNTIRLKVTETEAYVGPHDLACHSAKGKTERTKVMFEEGGVIYVYFVYGMHYMLNIVTEKRGHPAGVLIRAVENIYGPGNVTKVLKIDKKLYGKKAIPENGLWFEPREKGKKIVIQKSPRIGVNYAGPIWSKKHYRFTLKSNP
jgi:DNA-3-methyladenine glycosylase